MPRKSKRMRLNEKIAKMATVADLIAHLQTLPQDALVGVVGHFGEFLDFGPKDHIGLDFGLTSAYVTLDGSWRRGSEKEGEGWKTVRVVNVNAPDKGPDPD